MTRAKKVQDEYARLAAQYDVRWSEYIETSVRETLIRAPIRAGQRILDVGSGTGALISAVRQLIPGVEIVGADLSLDMLVQASRKRESKGLLASDAQHLPFRDGVFHGVLSNSSLHHWASPATVIGEIKRVVRPGGFVVITDWCGDFLTCRICTVFLRATGRSHPTPFSSVRLRRLLEENGFIVQHLDRYKVSWLWGLMTAGAALPEPATSPASA